MTIEQQNLFSRTHRSDTDFVSCPAALSKFSSEVTSACYCTSWKLLHKILPSSSTSFPHYLTPSSFCSILPDCWLFWLPLWWEDWKNLPLSLLPQLLHYTLRILLPFHWHIFLVYQQKRPIKSACSAIPLPAYWIQFLPQCLINSSIFTNHVPAGKYYSHHEESQLLQTSATTDCYHFFLFS